MRTHNPENERIKRRYFAYLKEAKRNSEASLDGVAKALHRFESYTRFRDFKAFHIQQAMAFKRYLADQRNAKTDKPLSKATLHSALNDLRGFFQWLAGQPGFRSRLSYSDADYFNLSEKDAQVARARREQPVPSLEQIQHVIRTMPADSAVERRDRALIAFTLLTGARDAAIASIKLKHVDLEEGRIIQDAREVRTKFSKTFTTYFFPVGSEIRQVVEDWIAYLQQEKLWGPDDPLFPATLVEQDQDLHFGAAGLARRHWSSAAPIRRIFKAAFARSGLTYFNPHSFRSTLAQLGERVCGSPEEFKAWSQNLGHEQVMTTFSSYGSVASNRQAEIIRGLSRAEQPDARTLELARDLIRVAQGYDVPR